jgi:Na+/melibiose symporter-like transporter
MLTGYVLELSGFVPNAEQSDSVKLALRSLYGLYPFVCFLVGARLFSRFSLGEAEYARIREVLRARNEAARETG